MMTGPDTTRVSV